MPGPRVLVAYGTRHGSTAEIAQVLAITLRERGLPTDVAPAAGVADVGPYHAVVVGAAVYMLRWHQGPIDFLHAHERALAARSVWLFESGPLDSLPETRVRPLPVPVAAIAGRIGIREHVTFGGRLEGCAADALESFMALGGLSGDYREWDRIRQWAGSIADVIAAECEAVPA